jgi:thioredoxin
MINATEYTYNDMLKNNDNVIIYCWADWCAPCKAFGPVYKEVSQENVGILFTKLDVDEQPTLKNKLNVQSIPTVLFYKKGQLMDVVVGATSKEDLNNRIKRVYV